MAGDDQAMSRLMVVSLGNRYRRDDGVGPYVLDQIRGRVGADIFCRENSGDVSDLLADWRGRSVYLIDAARGEVARAGEVLEFDGLAGALPVAGPLTSSHGLHLKDALELGQAIDSLPCGLHVYAICGDDFSHGTVLSPLVQVAAEQVAERILRKIDSFTGGEQCTSNP